MTPLQAIEGVYAAIAAGMGDTPLTFDGERYQPTSGTPWCRATVRLLPGGGMSIGLPGQRRATRMGILYGQAFAPHGTDDGVSAALTLAQTFAALVDGLDVTNTAATDPKVVNFTDATVRPIGIDGAWYQVNVEAPFSFVQIV